VGEDLLRHFSDTSGSAFSTGEIGDPVVVRMDGLNLAICGADQSQKSACREQEGSAQEIAYLSVVYCS
jgi:hypothetical protein